MFFDKKEKDKKEKGVVVTAEDSCQLSPRRRKWNHYCDKFKSDLRLPLVALIFLQGELVISCHANCIVERRFLKMFIIHEVKRSRIEIV